MASPHGEMGSVEGALPVALFSRPLRVGCLVPSHHTPVQTYTGYLLKMSPNRLRGWQRRWFVLRDGTIHYFHSELEAHTTPLGVVPLARCTYFKAEGWKLSIKVGPRLYVLKPELGKRDEYEGWVNALQETRMKLVAARGSDPDRASPSQSIEEGSSSSPRPGSATRLRTGTANSISSTGSIAVDTAELEKHRDAGTSPHYSGFLQKLSPSMLRGWQMRWFVLEDCFLHYYKTPTSSTPQSTIPLQNVVYFRTNERKGGCGLDIRVENRTFLLAADTRETANEWLQKLELSRQLTALRGVQKAPVSWSDGEEEDKEEEEDEGWTQDLPRTLSRPILKEGYLLKQDEKLKRWKKRYFILRGDELHYYKTKGTGDPKGIFPLTKVDSFSILSFGDKPGFQLVAPTKSFNFAANTQVEVREWVDALERVRSRGVRRLSRSSSGSCTLLPVTDERDYDAEGPVDIPMSGWLRKETPTRFKVMQKRLFKLENACLFYYRSPNDSNWAGCIPLERVALVRPRETTGFELKVSERIFFLMADTEEEARRWIRAIEAGRRRAIAMEAASANGARPAVSEGLADTHVCRSNVVQEFDTRGRGPLRFDILSDIEHSLAQREHALDGYDDVVSQLHEILEEIGLCTPPRHDVFEFYVDVYHSQVIGALETRASNDDLSMMQILPLASWIHEYGGFLVDVCAAENRAADLDSVILCLQGRYAKELRTVLATWSAGAVLTTFSSGDSSTCNDLFSLLNPQKEYVAKTDDREFFRACLETDLRTLESFHEALLAHLQSKKDELGTRGMCILANDGNKYTAYVAGLGAMLDRDRDTDDDLTECVERVTTGLQNVGHHALQHLATSLLSKVDKSMATLLGESWHNGSSEMANVVGKLEACLIELQTELDTACFEQLVLVTLDQLIRVFVSRFFVRTNKYDTQTGPLIDRDIEILKDPFVKFLPHKTVEKKLEVLEDIRQLVDSSELMIALHFDTLLDHHPDMTIDLLERLLSLRTDWTAEQCTTALVNCRKQLDDHPINNSRPGLFSSLDLSEEEPKKNLGTKRTSFRAAAAAVMMAHLSRDSSSGRASSYRTLEETSEGRATREMEVLETDEPQGVPIHKKPKRPSCPCFPRRHRKR